MAWECTQCGFTLESTNPPRECPECGAPQELLMWVQDEPVEDDEEDEYEAGMSDDEYEEHDDGEEEEEEHIPELGEELGVFFEPGEDDDLEE